MTIYVHRTVTAILGFGAFGAMLIAPAYGGSSPHLMVAMGDSITAGSLANTIGPKFWADGQVGPPTLVPDWFTLPGRLLPAPTDAGDPDRSLYETKNSYSWATGTRIQSMVVRLKDSLKRADPTAEVAALNTAIPGAWADKMPGQADEVLAAVRSGKYRSVKLVTMLIGANDACNAAAPDGVRAQLRETYARLARIPQPEPVRVIVSTLPIVPRLGSPEIRNALIDGIGQTCRRMRDEVFKLCPHLVQWSDEVGLDARVRELQAFNQMIVEEAERAGVDHPRLDVRVSRAFSEARILPGRLALDCFHPSRLGQEEIAFFLWGAQPWY